MCPTCTPTVRSLMNSRWPISRLVSPSATAASTSRSRAVSSGQLVAGRSARRRIGPVASSLVERAPGRGRRRGGSRRRTARAPIALRRLVRLAQRRCRRGRGPAAPRPAAPRPAAAASTPPGRADGAGPTRPPRGPTAPGRLAVDPAQLGGAQVQVAVDHRADRAGGVPTPCGHPVDHRHAAGAPRPGRPALAGGVRLRLGAQPVPGQHAEQHQVVGAGLGQAALHRRPGLGVPALPHRQPGAQGEHRQHVPGAAAGQQRGHRVQVAVGGLDVAEADPEPAAGQQQLDRVRAGRAGAASPPRAPASASAHWPTRNRPFAGDRQQPGLVGAPEPQRGQPLRAAAGDQHALLDAVQRAGEQLGQVQVGARRRRPGGRSARRSRGRAGSPPARRPGPRGRPALKPSAALARTRSAVEPSTRRPAPAPPGRGRPRRRSGPGAAAARPGARRRWPAPAAVQSAAARARSYSTSAVADRPAAAR